MNSNSSYIPKKIYMPRGIGVKEYAFYDDMNWPNRQYMEDGFFISDNILGDAGKSILFGVLDGHGGAQVVDFVKTAFTKEFADEYKKSSKDVVDVFKRTFARVDNLVKQKCASQEMGSTASIGFIRFEEAKRVLYLANVGDSYGLILDDISAQSITNDHKPSNPRELDRIKKAGGAVMFDRVGGVLAVSRAFGDHGLSGFGVISVPDVMKIDLRVIHKYLVIASDGLWDVVLPKEVLELSKIKTNSEEIAAELLKKAIANGSRDNISIMVLKLN